MIRHASRTRTQTEDMIECPWVSQTASDVSPIGKRHHARGHSDSRAARRSAASEGEIPGVGGRAKHGIEGLGPQSEFGYVGFADNDEAVRTQALHHQAIHVRNKITIDGRAECRAHTA